MVDRSSPIPLWAQLLEALKARISNGEFTDRFPTDKELTTAYGVSRQTVREALRHLELDGVLTRQRGKGTTLLKREFTQNLGTLYSLFREIEASGSEQRSITLIQTLTSNPEIATQLGLSPSDELFFLKRLRLANNLPLAIDETFLPASIGTKLLNVNFEHTALYDELRKRCNLQPTHGDEEIVPIIPSKTERDLLQITSKVAAFEIRRISYTNASSLEWRHTVIRGDRYSFKSLWSSNNSGTDPRSLKLGTKK